MKKFLFISDFDGTISNEDFYMIMINKYIGEIGHEHYKKWKNEEILDIDFLSFIFNNINQSEDIILEDIYNLDYDKSLKDFIKFVRDNNGEFIILSAGATYYIEKLMDNEDIKVEIYSNKADYKDNGIYYTIDENHHFYSKRYGIDKQKVVRHLKEKDEYDFVCYAGDTLPDYLASLECDYRFTKGILTETLIKEGIDCIPFKTFTEVRSELEKILNEE